MSDILNISGLSERFTQDIFNEQWQGSMPLEIGGGWKPRHKVWIDAGIVDTLVTLCENTNPAYASAIYLANRVLSNLSLIANIAERHLLSDQLVQRNFAESLVEVWF